MINRFLIYFYWSVVDLRCCLSFRCTAQWFHLFTDSAPFKVITQCWLYFSVLNLSWSSVLFYFIFSFIFTSWRLITLQYCTGFCHTLTWISHGFTCVPHPDPPSHLPLHLIPLGLPSAPGPTTFFTHSCLYLLITSPYLVPPRFPLCTSNHSLFSVSVSLFCYIPLFCFLYFTYKWYCRVFVYFCLTLHSA